MVAWDGGYRYCSQLQEEGAAYFAEAPRRRVRMNDAVDASDGSSGRGLSDGLAVHGALARRIARLASDWQRQ